MVGVFITQVNFSMKSGAIHVPTTDRFVHSTYLKQPSKIKKKRRFQIMKELEKYITDEKTGLRYELVGDY